MGLHLCEVVIKQMTDHVYLMDVGHESDAYLVVGEKTAMLIDTASGHADLTDEVRSITDKPFQVIHTHGHPDHVLGSVFFDKVLIHEKDIPLANQFAKDPAFEKYMAEHNLKMPFFETVEAGDVFDLGGMTLEVMECPGHTEGQIWLLLREERILFVGDSVNHHLWMQLEGCYSLERYAEILRNLEGISSRADRILHGHTLEFDDISLIKVVRMGLEEILAGKTDGDLPYEYFGGLVKQHPMAEDLKGGVICYEPTRIWEKK